MPEKRQLFRFRLPWAPASKPTTEPPPPRGGSTNGSSGTSQPSRPPSPGNVSTVRLPFKSSVSQTSSPRGSTTESGVASQPSSPPRTIPLMQTSSLPSSPVRQPRIASSASLDRQNTQETTFPEETKPSPPKKAADAVQEGSSSLPKSKPPSEPQIKSPTNTQVIPESQPDEMKTDSAKARDVHPNQEPEPKDLPRKAEKEKRPAGEFLKEEKAKARTHKESKKKQESFHMKKPVPNSDSHGLPHSHHEGRHRMRDSRHKFGSWNGNHGHGILHKEIKEDTLKLVRDLTSGKTKFRVEDSDYPVRVITVAGENKGASMHLSSDSESGKKDAPIHIHRGYRSNSDESTDATTDVEDLSEQDIAEEPKKLEEEEDEEAPEAYVNSNVQSVNNSIVFESSISARGPGVEILCSISKDKHNESSSDKLESVESHKAKFNPAPAKKVTYQPNIKRRCLRGLFLESSDSDPDNPDKPRRHGCRYGCGVRSKDKDADFM